MERVNILGLLEGCHEQSSRVYGVGGVSPTIMANGDGNKAPKIIEKKIVGAIFQEPTKNEKGAFNLIKEDKVMVKELGYIDNGTGKHQSNTVYGTDNLSPAITTVKDGGTQQIKICRIETRYRIRKLTPRECFRLMDFSDEDYDKAEKVNSQTQLYKEAGNSIVRAVLVAIMSQLNIDGVKSWNNMSDEERVELSGKIKNQTSDK